MASSSVLMFWKAVQLCPTGETFYANFTQQFEYYWQLRLTPEMAIIKQLPGKEL
jgi:hypothetical protein